MLLINFHFEDQAKKLCSGYFCLFRLRARSSVVRLSSAAEKKQLHRDVNEQCGRKLIFKLCEITFSTLRCFFLLHPQTFSLISCFWFPALIVANLYFMSSNFLHLA